MPAPWGQIAEIPVALQEKGGGCRAPAGSRRASFVNGPYVAGRPRALNGERMICPPRTTHARPLQHPTPSSDRSVLFCIASADGQGSLAVGRAGPDLTGAWFPSAGAPASPPTAIDASVCIIVDCNTRHARCAAGPCAGVRGCSVGA